MIGAFISDRFFRRLEKAETGSLRLTTPDGKVRVFAGRTPGMNATLTLHSWRVVGHLMRRGDVGLAEAYRVGDWETDDLVALTAFGLVNRHVLDQVMMGSGLWRRVFKVLYLLRLNSITGSRQNIQAHYDLGNAFYELWLDASMTYSSAIFDHPQQALEDAQQNKYDRILNRLGPASGRLLEIGCGWGGFVARAQQKGDFAIKGITLSEEQYAYATARVAPSASIVLEDYRHQSGRFDHIVSIEMFEAVGEQYWSTYFGKIKELLAKGGKALVQVITIREEDFLYYRRGGDFIRSYIFPGGMLPSPMRFRQAAEHAGLCVQDAYAFGPDYARTLEQWLQCFERRVGEVQALGFDDGFIRLWRFYLAACIAAFQTGHTDVMQVDIAHA